MSRTRKGSKPGGIEYWGKRPLAGCPPSAEAKRITHRIERQRNKNEARAVKKTGWEE